MENEEGVRYDMSVQLSSGRETFDAEFEADPSQGPAGRIPHYERVDIDEVTRALRSIGYTDDVIELLQSAEENRFDRLQ